MNIIARFFCFLGMHFGELFAGSVPGCGLTVMKRCACGRLWYDAAGPFADPIWIPITDEEVQVWLERWDKWESKL